MKAKKRLNNRGQVLAAFVAVILLLSALPLVSATAPPEHPHIPEIQSVVTVGPGTIISVRRLDLPFSRQIYVVKYRTDAGSIIEVWHHGTLAIVQDMHGMLTYSQHPEQIISFRVVTITPPSRVSLTSEQPRGRSGLRAEGTVELSVANTL
jgi:hypothetical protein